MSAPHQKLPASNITCRYWATSGTCFFGDQCNFAHNIADRATSGRPVPRREKACKELLLNGYCKNEQSGCEYNHSIPGVTYSGAPTPSTGAPNSMPASTWAAPSSRAGSSSGVSTATTSAAAGIRSKELPVTAPAFVPAAVAAAQRASLTAWGGLTPGVARDFGSVTSIAEYVSVGSLDAPSSPSLNEDSAVSATTAAAVTVSSPSNLISSAASIDAVGSPLESDGIVTTENLLSGSTFMSSALQAGSNAQPFVPSSLSLSNSNHGITPPVYVSSGISTMGGANAPPYVPSGVAFSLGAAPYVPKAKQHLLGGTAGGGRGGGVVGRSMSDPSGIGVNVPPHPQQQLHIRQHLSQQLQLQQQQAVHMMAVARSMGGNAITSPYMNMDVPMVMQPFRLPDGDDPALGMTAMSPPNPAFALPIGRSSNGGSLSALPASESLASVGIVGDGPGNSQLGSGFPSSHSNYGSNLQSPSSRTRQAQQDMQKLQIKQHPPPPLLPSHPNPFSFRPPQKFGMAKQSGGGGIGVLKAEKQPFLGLPSDIGLVSEGRKVNIPPNLFTGDSHSQMSDHLPPLQGELDPQQPMVTESPPLQQQISQRQQSPSHHQQQRQQQVLQQQMHILQQRPQSSNLRAISSPVQPQQRPPFHSSSPLPHISTGAATTTHGVGAYFIGPGQGVSTFSHGSQGSPFSGFAGRGAEGRARGQSNVGMVPPGPRFMSDQLREELRRRHALIHAQLDTDQNLVNLPDALQRFHTLYPLEEANREDESSAAFGIHSMIFKGISSSDGLAYAIRRLDSRQVPPNRDVAASAAEVVDKWAPIARHPQIVAIRDSFVSREIDDTPALFLVHDYYPGAATLDAIHLQQDQGGAVSPPMMVSEELLWSYMVQLAAVLRAVHSSGLHFQRGSLHPSKVILCGRGRLRVSSIGVLDILHGDPPDDPQIFQRDDLIDFGGLILSLACGSVMNPSLEFMSAHYSTELVQVTQALLASRLDKSDGGISSVRPLYSVLTQRMFGEIEKAHLQNDDLMSELSKETENGRLLRILVKLGMTTQRQEDDLEPDWSDNGDRYCLKLFRDYVFHQTNEDGSRLIDWTHIIDSLNKLDAGVSEKMILFCHDERSMLVPSYGDVKQCLEGSYQELASKGSSNDKTRLGIVGSQPSLLSQHSRLKQRQIM